MAESDTQHRGTIEEAAVLLRQIILSLVDYPASVKMSVEKADGKTFFRVRVIEVDLGKMIGKQGRTARPIRTILKSAILKIGHRFTFDVVGSEE